jgi:hypothetical protein
LPKAQIEKKLKVKLMRDDFSYSSIALQGAGSISSEVGRYPMIKPEVARYGWLADGGVTHSCSLTFHGTEISIPERAYVT